LVRHVTSGSVNPATGLLNGMKVHMYRYEDCATAEAFHLGATSELDGFGAGHMRSATNSVRPLTDDWLEWPSSFTANAELLTPCRGISRPLTLNRVAFSDFHRYSQLRRLPQSSRCMHAEQPSLQISLILHFLLAAPHWPYLTSFVTRLLAVIPIPSLWRTH
jgi:hypothetical protein